MNVYRGLEGQQLEQCLPKAVRAEAVTSYLFPRDWESRFVFNVQMYSRDPGFLLFMALRTRSAFYSPLVAASGPEAAALPNCLES